jgi:hypothetical protein
LLISVFMICAWTPLINYVTDADKYRATIGVSVVFNLLANMLLTMDIAYYVSICHLCHRILALGIYSLLGLITE